MLEAPEQAALEVDPAGPGGAVRTAPPGGLAGGTPRSGLTPLLSVLRDANGANLAAGLTAGLWYAFGAIPVHLDAAAGLGLSPAAASSWFFIVFVTSAVSSLVLTLRFRQPLAIGWTIPGLVLLTTAGRPYTHGEIAGAGLVAGAAIVALGLLGIGERVLRWLPLPIVMGMFAGSVLGNITGIFAHLGAQPWAVGGAVLGYLGARALGRSWLPPVGGAVAAGLAAAALAGQVHAEAFRWSPPLVAPVRPALSAGSLLALALPLVVLAVGMGNVQGIGFLVSQGYRPRIGLLTVVVGLCSLVNAAFGGHPATIQRVGVAIVGGEAAGPRDQRYVSSLLAALCALLLGLCATTAGTLLGVLPPALVAALAGLALLGPAMDALRRAVVTELPTGAFFALAIAASPLTILGIGSAFWALIGGVLVSLALERPALLRALRVA
jgi:benzoate membrane transport protein